MNECWLFCWLGVTKGIASVCTAELASAEVRGGRGRGPGNVNGAPSRAVVDGSQKQGVEMPQARGRHLSLPVTAWSEILRRPSVFGSEHNQPARMITRSRPSIIGGPRTMAAHVGPFASVVRGPQLTPLNADAMSSCHVSGVRFSARPRISICSWCQNHVCSALYRT